MKNNYFDNMVNLLETIESDKEFLQFLNEDRSYHWWRENNIFHLYKYKTGLYCFFDQGAVLKLSNDIREFEFDCHQEFQNLCAQENILIESMNVFESVKIKSLPYYYTEYQRPENSLGKNIWDYVGENILTTDIVLETIQEHKRLLEVTKLYEEKNKNHCPHPQKLYKFLRGDKNNFWIDFKKWDIDWGYFLKESIRGYDIFFHFMKNIDCDLDYELLSSKIKELKNEF